MSLYLRLKSISLAVALSVIFTLNTPYQARAGGLVQTSQGNVGGAESAQLLGTTGYLLLTILVGYTIMYPTILTMRKNQADEFYERFKARPRKVQTDLKRRKGKMYRWVTKELLDLSPRERRIFSCLLKEKSDQLDRRLKRAQSLKRKSVDRLTNWLISQGSKSKKPNTACALEEKYLSNPKRFASNLKMYRGPNVEWLLTKHLDRAKFYLTPFRCQLRKLRAPIASSIKSLQDPKQRAKGARLLSKILKRLEKSWESTRCKLD